MPWFFIYINVGVDYLTGRTGLRRRIAWASWIKGLLTRSASKIMADTMIDNMRNTTNKTKGRHDM
jgi:hypothetical protein